MFTPSEPDQMDVEKPCDKEERSRACSQSKSHTLEESTPQVDLNQESNKLNVEETCDDVVEHHTDVLHDDLHAFEDLKNIVPLVDIQRRLKGKNPLIEKLSKKPKKRDDDVSHCPIAIEKTLIPVATYSDSVDLEYEDDDVFFQVFANIYASYVPSFPVRG
ncbi:hypothetical protein Sjap_017101 [Stephania japonica]|uniref:Uncharacterized protein n=1 Tax=Stephania japonica TaxID=461633 RepID=A0AAP0I5I7_9MAGN